MKVEIIESKLINIENNKNKSNINKSNILLERVDNNEMVNIIVDESVVRIANRIRDALQGEREKIYLSRCMTNIDVDCRGNEWIIDEEDGRYKKKKKNDIMKLEILN